MQAELIIGGIVAGLVGLFILLTKANAASLRRTVADATRPTSTPDPWPGPSLGLAPLLRFGLDDLAVIEGDARPLPALPRDVSPAPIVRIPTATPAAGWNVSRWTPTRAPTVESDLAVVFGQAFGLALCVAIGGGLIAWALAWSWRGVAVAAGVTLLLAVLWRLRVADGLLQVVETAIGKNLTGDEIVGRPVVAHLAAVNAPAARATVAQNNRAAEDAAQLKALADFTRRCYAVGTSESAQGIKPSGRADYLAHRDLLLALGLAMWRVPGQPKAGWRMTTDQAAALDVLRRHVISIGAATTRPDAATQ